jgi:hypothetical protein
MFRFPSDPIVSLQSHHAETASITHQFAAVAGLVRALEDSAPLNGGRLMEPHLLVDIEGHAALTRAIAAIASGTIAAATFGLCGQVSGHDAPPN